MWSTFRGNMSLSCSGSKSKLRKAAVFDICFVLVSCLAYCGRKNPSLKHILSSVSPHLETVSFCLLPSSCWFLLWLTLNFDGGDTFLRNVCWLSTRCTALDPRRQKSYFGKNSFSGILSADSFSKWPVPFSFPDHNFLWSSLMCAVCLSS
jgi:hypothetical protein